MAKKQKNTRQCGRAITVGLTFLNRSFCTT